MPTSIKQFSLKPTIYSGSGSRSMLIGAIQQLGGNNVLLITDQGLNKAGVTDQIKNLFAYEQKVKLVGVFDEIQQDARGININKGVQLMMEYKADTIVALGGGSVLDTAKCIKWMLHNKYEDINLVLKRAIREDFSHGGLMNTPLIAIPTTAGTGAEISPVAVSFNDNLNVKTFIRNPEISPNISILDAELTVGLPPRITAFTGIDAFTHAIEAFFAKGANPFSDAFAIHAIKLIKEYLPRAVNDGKDLEARENMLLASMMGMTAFAHGATENPVHNVAHVFGAKYRIPHGLANAVILPKMIEQMPEYYLPRITLFSSLLGIDKVEQESEKTIKDVVQFIDNLLNELKLPTTFDEYDIHENDFVNIIEEVHNDPSGERFRLPDDVIVKVAYEVSGF